jgi:hypothetical protein
MRHAREIDDHCPARYVLAQRQHKELGMSLYAVDESSSDQADDLPLELGAQPMHDLPGPPTTRMLTTDSARAQGLSSD